MDSRARAEPADQLIPDKPLLSIRRVWYAFRLWLDMIVLPETMEEATYVPLWRMLVFNRRPYAEAWFDREVLHKK